MSLKCERLGCKSIPIGEFRRVGRERPGWHRNMPIALCEEHAKDRQQVVCSIKIIEGKLIIIVRNK